MPIPLLALLSVGQAIYGGIQANKARRDFDAAASEQKPYKTPQEFYDILNATQNNAQSGYDATTLDFLTNQTGRAFSGSLSTLQRLGGDANSASQLFDQQMQSIMKIGANNHALNLENFSKYMSALDSVGNSKAAEQASQQNLVRNRMQAANSNRQAGFQNIQSGVNAGISAISAAQTANLYRQQQNLPVDNTSWSSMNASIAPIQQLNTSYGMATPIPANMQVVNFNPYLPNP